MYTIGEYLRAGTIEEIWAALGRATFPARILAGGTDLLPRIRIEAAERISAVDVSRVGELAGITRTPQGLRIGAATKLSDIELSTALTGAWGVLAKGAGSVGSGQIRNLATLGGNICNASPAADTVPALLVLDAQAEILSQKGRRVVPLAEFFRGPGRTVLEAGEILSAILIPQPPSGAAATYLKHSPRRAMDLSIVGVGVLLARSTGRLEARIALGAVAPTARRARSAEALLAGAAQLDEATISQAARLAAQAAAPIDDVRGSAEYRVAMVEALTARALRQTLEKL